MPAYDYECPSCGVFEQFFKTLPSEKKQKEFPCPDCGEMGKRLLGRFYANGAQHGGMEEAAGMAMKVADIGGRLRPVFTDNNGQTREVKTSADIDMWRRNNQLGKPRMVEWTNPKTGEKSWEPQRVKMVANPMTGEPMDAPLVRESERLVPLDNHFEMKSEGRTGIPIDPNTGVRKVMDLNATPLKYNGTKMVDPETGKPMTIGDCWGSKGVDAIPAAKPGELKAVHKVLKG